ncbi:MAG: hypothetical protein AAF546_02000 [Verrucomicrobiota bacterium]
MVRKELYMFIMALNLVRALMREASKLHGCDLSRISFKAIVDTLIQFSFAIYTVQNAPRVRRRIIDNMLIVIASDSVSLRQHRSKPIALKRRPKPF